MSDLFDIAVTAGRRAATILVDCLRTCDPITRADLNMAMVEGYVAHFRIPIAPEELRRECLEWATTRGSRSGRVAWQYIQDLAGRSGVRLS